MPAPTKKDWALIHAKAWKDPKFRALLETDPKKAITAYAKEHNKTFDKIFKVAAKPKGVADEHLHKVDMSHPPACC